MNVIDEYESSTALPTTTKMVLLGLSALGSRALVWVSTLGAGALWAVAMMEPTILKIVTATCYCVTVLLPVLVRDVREVKGKV